MSRKLYDYDKCFEIARQCSSSTEFQRLNGSAYNVALHNKWLKDYVWFVRKQHAQYTYEEVYEIAKKYTCSSDFQKGNGSAYGKARAKGWIKDYIWFEVKHRSPYTYEQCYDIAKRYKSRTELARGNVGVYQASLNHGWLNDYSWFESPQLPYNYWTKDRVVEESKNYKTRSEFHDKCGTAYSKARINGWLNEFTWLKDDRIDFSTDKVDCVYAYEFKEYSAVYVGRTLMRRIQERIKEHQTTVNDAVYLFANNNQTSIPEMRILEDNLTLAEGVEKEGTYLEIYQKEGWTLLNRAKTGGIGTIAKNKWSKKTSYSEALKYKTRGDFAIYSSRAYEVSRRKGWLDEYTWFEEKQRPAGFWDNYDNCYEAAVSCKNKSEFSRKYNRAYVVSRNNGWIERFTWLNVKRIAHNKKWYRENVLEEARKYKTKKEFENNARGAYKVAIINDWMKDFDWFEDTHSVLSKAIKASKKRVWTYDRCKQLAAESKGRKDFHRKSGGAYCAAWNNHWLDDFPKQIDSTL